MTNATVAIFVATTLLSAANADARTTLPVYGAAKLESVCKATLQRAKLDIATLEAVPLDKVTVINTFDVWNRMQARVEDISGLAELYADVSPNEKVRMASEQCSLRITAFNTELNQNEKLYQRVRAVKPLTPHQEKLRKDLLEGFEDAGVALSEEKRARAKAILNRLEMLNLAFDRNIREDKTELVFAPEEMQGLPQTYLDKAKRDEKGNYLLSFDYPEFEPFMELADTEVARKRYYIAFMNRGGETNLKLMNEISALRLELAKLHDLPSYAHFVLRRRMAERPDKVNAFLDEVKRTIRDLEIKEIAELRAAKAETLGKKPEEVTVNRWDVDYYQEKIRKARFDIDQEGLRKYFPMPAAMDYAMYISSQLYGVEFKRVDVPVWRKDVIYYDVIDSTTSQQLSGFYLDLYPRDGKFKHAAAIAVRSASRIAHRLPVSVLVANLDKEGLNQGELETLLHEFGHVLNNVLSVVDYVAHGSPQWDFIEAPSQMYEEWARRPEALALFQKVCSACPVMEKSLVERLENAHRFGSGIRYGRQHLYATFDMAMTGEHPGDALEVWKAMEANHPLGFPEGTIFPAGFAHIVNGGYGAGYYGYMWSEVLALDMLSAYGDNLMNPEVGRRFRDLVLAQGGQWPSKELPRRFLGREPSSKAFFAEITGQR